MPSMKVACDSCDSTGLYCGFAEPKGEAVICLDCKGIGAQDLVYKEFTGRKRRSGISTVRRSQGRFVPLGVGGAGQAMSYDEFTRSIPGGR